MTKLSTRIPAAGQFRLRHDVQIKGKLLYSLKPLSVTTVNAAAARIVSALNSESFVSPETIAQRTGMESTAVRRLCEQLHERALIEWEPARDDTYRPLVSIVVTTLNAADDIGPCLDALASLEYAPYEVLVVDGGSTDRTVTIAQDHELATNGQLQIIEAGSPTEPISIGAGRNRGIAAADSDVIAFTDADCRPRSQWLSELVPVLATHDLVGGRVRPYRNRTSQNRGWLQTTATMYEGQASSLDMGPRNARVDPTGDTPYVPTANLLCRREVVESLQFPDRNIAEDVSLCWRALESGFDVVYSASGVVEHEYRDRLMAAGNRKSTYAQSEALLAKEFGYNDPVPVPVVPLFGTVFTVCALLFSVAGAPGGLVSLFAAVGFVGVVGPTVWTTFAVLRRLSDTLPTRDIVIGILRSAVSTWYSVSRELARYYSGPLIGTGLLVAAAGAVLSRYLLTVMGGGLIGIGVFVLGASLLVELIARRPEQPVGYALWALVDTASYQIGAYAGIIEHRTARHLLPWRRFGLVVGVGDLR